MQELRVRHHRRLECLVAGLEPDSSFVCVLSRSLRAKRTRELPFRIAPLQRRLESKEGCYRLLLRLHRLGVWILLGQRSLLQGEGRFLFCTPRSSYGRLVSLLFLRARACVLEPMPSSLCRKGQVWGLLPDSRSGPRFRGRISALYANPNWSTKHDSGGPFYAQNLGSSYQKRSPI